MAADDFLTRTRTSYDSLASDYAERFRHELTAKPLDRAVLDGFAALVKATGAGPAADVGCGPGRIAAYLDGRELPVFGVDLSPQMVAVAKREHPHLQFQQGSITELDLPSGSLGGIVAWYSIIHIPDEHLPGAFAEFYRVLAPGGYVQLAFAVGDTVLHRTEAGGHEVSLDFHPREPGIVAGLLCQAGLPEYARLVRQPDEEGELTPQAFLLARKPPVAG